MARIDEDYSALFHQWEKHARGWQVHPQPVAPEPPFAPFIGRDFFDKPVVDDGRKPGLFSSIMRSLTSGKTAPVTPPAIEEQPNPEALEREELVELPLNLPPSFTAKPQEFAQFLRVLPTLPNPLRLS